MPKIIEGYSFPDDATPQEINAFLRKQRQEKAKNEDVPPEGGPPKKEEMSWGEYGKGLGRSALAGLTFNYGDEILAGIRSLGGEKYDDAVADERKKLKDFQGQYPVVGTATEIAGSVPTMLVPGLGVARGAMTAGRFVSPVVKEGAKLGAKQGALGGLGEAEGGFDAEGLLARGKGAVFGGGVGALAGAGTTAAVEAAAPVARNIMERVRPSMADETAMQKVLQDLERAGLTPEQARDRWKQMTATGAPAQLFDVAPSLTSRAESIVQRPGAGGEAIVEDIIERQAGQRSRVMDASRQAITNGARLDFFDASDAIDAMLRQNAKPFYERAYRAALPEPAQFELQTIADSVKKAFPSAEAYARRLYAADRADFGRLGTRDAGTGVPMKEFDAIPQVQKWDYLMRGLNQSARRAGYDSELGRVALNLRRQIAEVLDNNVDDFAAARAIYRGDKEVQGALEAGRDFMRTDPQELSRIFNSMSEAERQAYRIGALKDVRDKIFTSKDTADATNRIGQNVSDRRDAFRVIIRDPAAADLFEETLKAEARLVQNARRMVEGSPTARRKALDRDLDADDMGVLGIAADVANGSPTTLFRRMLTVLSKDVAIPEARAESISKILRAGSEREINRVVTQLERYSEDQARRRAYQTLQGARAASAAGRELGSRAASEESQPSGPSPYAQ